jgi:hypothetical protein
MLVLAQLDDDEDGLPPLPDPDPAFVLAQRPSPVQVMEAAAFLGLFPDASYLAGHLRVSGLG